MDTVEYVNKQRKSRSDCTDAHAHLTFAVHIGHKGIFPMLCIICCGYSLYHLNKAEAILIRLTTKFLLFFCKQLDKTKGVVF